MSRLTLLTKTEAQSVVETLYKDVERRIIASPPGMCPVDMAASFLKLCHSQTCGKCVPCRVGLAQLSTLLDQVMNGTATEETVDLIEKTARVIKNSADCAIGFESANMVLRSVIGFRDDFLEHVNNHRCLGSMNEPVPCIGFCPANVDIPGYVALVHAGRSSDAVRLIRKDNPFPVSCDHICEHPCENHCRRNIIDDAINIRGLKRYACETAGDVPVPDRYPDTGKKIAVIGGGPAGLSAAYFLSLMGHSVTIFEQRQKLGGMLRYGIPSYRLPREMLDQDINAILSTGGIEVKYGVSIGKDITLEQIHNNYDAIYISIGAQTDKKLGVPGENSIGVMSAVSLLRGIGDGKLPDFAGKKVVVVGGGNVAMDCTRTAKRLGAASVTCVYRRRQSDMTALAEEVEGAIAEGCEIYTMQAPVRIETDENENAVGLWVQKQLPGEIDKSGRPKPINADVPEELIPCDLIIVAIGQNVDFKPFEAAGLPIKRGSFSTMDTGGVSDWHGIFAGGDCATGPATAIRAIASGKVAAANIDEYLGFYHEIVVDIDIPAPSLGDNPARGRVNPSERPASERAEDFNLIEYCMTEEEAMHESGRCLRCDHFGYGVFKGGRKDRW